jgi:hypothetical protein
MESMQLFRLMPSMNQNLSTETGATDLFPETYCAFERFFLLNLFAGSTVLALIHLQNEMNVFW